MQKLKINNLLKFIFVIFSVHSFTVSEGQQIFERNFYHNNNSITPLIIKQISDGYIVAGNLLTAASPNQFRALLIKYDTLFNIQWNKAIGIPQYNRVHDLLVLSDSTIVISGVHQEINSNVFNLTLTRLDRNGNILCSGQ